MADTKIEEGIFKTPHGFRAEVSVGSGSTLKRMRHRFPATATVPDMRTWRRRALAMLERTRTHVARGTLASDVAEYLRVAALTAANRKRREQQLAWWCAQHVTGPVRSVAAVAAEQAARERCEAVSSARRLGAIPRASIESKRVREILALAFQPTDAAADPTAHASTSNSYRTALLHLFNVLDQDAPDAVNPVERIHVRPQQGPQLAGQDARVVREILRHVPSKFGRPGDVSAIRLAVLAWVHITPTQLMGLTMPRDFHDQPGATREDIIGGVITLTKPPRLKGRFKRLPAPETIPLNPYGVEAMRAYAEESAAWGKFSLPPLNKVFKRACRRAQAALEANGVAIDLSGMTLYHLKHSLATTAAMASAGLVNRYGAIQQSAGVQRALDHAHARTTTIYTQAAVDPIVRHVNAATSLFLDHLFTVPLPTAKATLRLVAK